MSAQRVLSAVRSALLDGVRSRDVTGMEDAFFVCDLGHLKRQLRTWRECLPRAAPHYAVKCNDDGRILKRLANLGAGFDCASEAEMQAVLCLGVYPERIIYAHPCKNRKGLRFARYHGVRHMTFDNSDELLKIKAEYPEAQLILRIFADDPDAASRLSAKYGVSVAGSKLLLALAAELGLEVCGVSFHVGSGAKNSSAYTEALQGARGVFEHAAGFGFRMHTLDIGGGFTQGTFRSFAPVIRAALDEYFPSSEIRVIAEPGRYFVEGAMTLACSVTARRQPSPVMHDKDAVTMLYLSDGCYGSFGNCVWENFRPTPRMLRCHDKTAIDDCGRWRKYILWGPTCDAMDRVNDDCWLDHDVQVDDWLYFENMGAYTLVTTTGFNGYANSRHVIYIDTSRPAGRPRKGGAGRVAFPMLESSQSCR